MRDAVQAARSAALAGVDIVRARGLDMGKIRAKSSATDLVTEADIASGVAIARVLVEQTPGVPIVCEEPEVYDALGITPGSLDDDEVWIIDPIDGTTSFVHGYPCFSVSVGLAKAGRSVAGVVYNVPMSELFAAGEGLGATCNDVPIHCSQTPSVSSALLVTGFPYDRGQPLDRQLAALAAFLRAPVHGIRRDGSAAIDCCHVAAGRADGYWEFALQPWDTAAGVIIAAEAGATVTTVDGASWSPDRGASIVVANPELHRRILDVIESSQA